MELDDLRAFAVLAEARDLDRAGRGLHASASTVRRSIARLEHDFGGPLIDPSSEGVPGGLILTPMGEQVLDKALDVLESAADLLHAIHRPSHRPYVVIGSLFRLLVSEILDAIPVLDRLSGGDVSVETRETSDDDPSGGLSRGRVDAAVLAGPTDLDGSLVRRSVGQVARVALLARHHPLAGRTGIEVRELDRDVWVEGIHVPDGSWSAYWRCDDVRGGPPQARTPVNGLAGQMEAIRVGAGVCVRPAPLPLHLGLVDVVAIPLVDAPPCPLDIAYRLDTPSAGLFDSLADQVSLALDNRPVGVRIRASSVVAGSVVTGYRSADSQPADVASGMDAPATVAGHTTQTVSVDLAPSGGRGGYPRPPERVRERRTRLGLTGRLRSLTTGRAE